METIAGLKVAQSLNERSKTHVVILHGYGANADDLLPLKGYWDTKREHNWYFVNGFLRLEDMGPTTNSRAWFPIDMAAYETAVREGKFRDMASRRPPGLDEARDRLLKFIQEILPSDGRLILGGFSQGAMLSTELSFYLFSVLKGLIVLSGSYLDEANWSKRFNVLKGVPFIQSHGEEDTVLSYKEAERLYQSFHQAGMEGEFIGFKGGHEIPIDVVEKVKTFITTIA